MTWADQTDRLRTVTVHRGRPFNLDRVEAGTATFTFRNEDGHLDPANPAGPYYGDILPLNEIVFGRRANGVTYQRFTGRIERYEPLWVPPNYQEVTVQATDAFEQLANVTLVSGTSSLTTALTGANNDLVFTAREAGGRGDDITVEYVVAGTNTALSAGTNDPIDGNAQFQVASSPLLQSSFWQKIMGGLTLQPTTATPVPVQVTVSGSDIVVNVATDGAGAPTSTASQIKTLLEGSDAVMALVSIALAPANTGAGVVTAMAQTHLDGGKWVSESTGDRITRVLDEAGWDATKRAIDPGVFDVVAQGFSESENVSALTHLQDVADSELGYVFIDGNGNVVYHDGGHRSRETRSTVSQATFADDGTGFAYRDLEISLDKDRIVNHVTVTAASADAVAQTVEDSGSQTVYGTRSLSKQTLLLNDADALTVAEAILNANKDPRTRFERIVLVEPEITFGQEPASDSWSVGVLGREIGDLVTVRTSPPGESPYTISYDCFVEAIEDERGPGLPWQVAFRLTLFSEGLSEGGGVGDLGELLDSTGDTFVLDSATAGVLG